MFEVERRSSWSDGCDVSEANREDYGQADFWSLHTDLFLDTAGENESH